MSSATPYHEGDLPPDRFLTTFLWEVRAPGRVEATGECPQCRCVITPYWMDVQYVAKGPTGSDRRKFDNGEPKPVVCACPAWHAGRPASVRNGCGFLFYIAMPPRRLGLAW
ncbi:hypothetical protein [Streptomyces sp. NPDC001744]|uniref:hypothetical protein n=1 Tax=Streptomyces sp. NPDC001744 TaxID=3364606 RepID=UPI0036A3EDDF